MLLSSASATLDAPSARAVATTSCLPSEDVLRNMTCSFKATAVRKNGPGANGNLTFPEALAAQGILLPSDRTSCDGGPGLHQSHVLQCHRGHAFAYPVKPQQRV